VGAGAIQRETPKDPTIRAKFNTYRFKDYMEQVIELLERVCRVSVETVKVIDEMLNEDLSKRWI